MNDVVPVDDKRLQHTGRPQLPPGGQVTPANGAGRAGLPVVVPPASPTDAPSRPRGSDAWLLASNLLTLGLAVWQGWSLLSLLLPFWLQSAAIGVLQARRMGLLQSLPPEDAGSKGRPAESADEIRRTRRTFMLHYGGFHAAYLLVLLIVAAAAKGGTHGMDAWLLPCIVGLLVSEWLAHRDDVRRDASRRPPLGVLMVLPYLRIVPMHMMLFIGSVAGSSPISVVAFMLLKTAADWALQWGKRKYEQGAQAAPASRR